MKERFLQHLNVLFADVSPYPYGSSFRTGSTTIWNTLAGVSDPRDVNFCIKCTRAYVSANGNFQGVIARLDQIQSARYEHDLPDAALSDGYRFACIRFALLHQRF